MHKWMHYFPVYEAHLAPSRGKKVRMLEIGVSHGGSLEMWRSFLGRRCTIVGVDIDPRVSQLEAPGLQIRIGDQADAEFLGALRTEFDTFDIILDDGGHHPAAQIASFEALWPTVPDGGIYMVEDLHTSYWPAYGGAPGSADSFIGWLHRRIDDLHAFHSRTPGFEPNDWTRTIGSIHIYDSIVVVVKEQRSAPEVKMSGRPSFDDVYGVELSEVLDEEHARQIESTGSPVARVRRLARHPVTTTKRVADRVAATRRSASASR